MRTDAAVHHKRRLVAVEGDIQRPASIPRHIHVRSRVNHYIPVSPDPSPCLTRNAILRSLAGGDIRRPAGKTSLRPHNPRFCGRAFRGLGIPRTIVRLTGIGYQCGATEFMPQPALRKSSSSPRRSCTFAFQDGTCRAVFKEMLWLSGLGSDLLMKPASCPGEQRTHLPGRRVWAKNIIPQSPGGHSNLPSDDNTQNLTGMLLYKNYLFDTPASP